MTTYVFKLDQGGRTFTVWEVLQNGDREAWRTYPKAQYSQVKKEYYGSEENCFILTEGF